MKLKKDDGINKFASQWLKVYCMLQLQNCMLKQCCVTSLNSLCTSWSVDKCCIKPGATHSDIAHAQAVEMVSKVFPNQLRLIWQ